MTTLLRGDSIRSLDSSGRAIQSASPGREGRHYYWHPWRATADVVSHRGRSLPPPRDVAQARRPRVPKVGVQGRQGDPRDRSVRGTKVHGGRGRARHRRRAAQSRARPGCCTPPSVSRTECRVHCNAELEDGAFVIKVGETDDIVVRMRDHQRTGLAIVMHIVACPNAHALEQHLFGLQFFKSRRYVEPVHGSVGREYFHVDASWPMIHKLSDTGRAYKGFRWRITGR